MGKLLLKDFLILKKNLLLLVSCIIVTIIFGAASVYIPEGGSDRTFLMQNLFYMWSILYAVFIGLIIPMTHEKFLNTDMMLKSTSLGMLNMVASKYIFGMIIFAFVTLIGKSSGIIYMNIIGRGYDGGAVLSDIKYAFVFNLLIMIVFITANYCLDKNKMRYFQMLIYIFMIIGPAVILSKITAMSGDKVVKITDFIVNNGASLQVAIAVILLGMVWISLMLSTKIGRYIEN